MLTYKYTARDPATGKKVESFVQADSEKAAAKLVQKEGYSPISIKPAQTTNKFLGKFTNRIKSQDKVLFSRQLSTLINAGLPLVQSLRNVAAQTTSKPLKIVIGEVITIVEGGKSFSEALARYPSTFNEIYVSLVAAGEASGTLDRSLERLANQQEKDAEIISKVRGALVYPLVVIGVMILVVGFMVIGVLPQVKVLYEGIDGAEMPFVTKILLAFSDFVKKFWWAILIFLGLCTFLTTRWARTFGGKRAIDKLKMRMKPLGPLFMKLYMARFARTATTLVSSGVPLLQIMEITARSVNNVHVEESLLKAAEKVKGGKSLSDALTGDPNFLELVPNMIRIGEQSGSLEDMLAKVADYYEREVDNQIKTIQTIIEPALMIILGICAIVVVVAVLLPVYNLAGKTLIK